MFVSGLEGVVAAETGLSDVDGERGRLVLAGQDVERLAGTASFEQVCTLLWSGSMPDASRSAAERCALGAARAQAFERIHMLGDALDAPNGMDALRASVAHLESDRVRSASPTSDRAAAGGADQAR